MLWDDLRYVLELAVSGSLPKASERLGVSRSTITRRLRDLEAESGTTIFTRNRHRYVPTEAGAALIDDLQALDAKVKRMERKLLFGKKDSRGKLKIAFSDPVLTIPFMRMLAVFCERFPNIDLEVVTELAADRPGSTGVDLVIKYLESGPQSKAYEHLFDFAWALYDTPQLANDASHKRTWVTWSKTKYFVSQKKWLDSKIPTESKVIQVDSIELCFLSALSGLGRTLLPCYIGDNDRSLKRVESPVGTLDTQIHIETLNDPETNGMIELFLEFTRMASFRSSKLLESSLKRDT